MIVTVSNERETEGWPPDPACWFLVRPFGAADVLRALRAPVPPGPAARAPVATRRRASGREAAARPGAAETEPAREEAPAQPEPTVRLSTDDSLWDVDTGITRRPAPPVMEPPPLKPIAAEPEVPPAAPPLPPPLAQPPAPPPSLPPAQAPVPVLGATAEPGDAPPIVAEGAAAVEADGAAEPAEEPQPSGPPLPRVRSRRTLAEVVGALVLVVAAGLGGIAIGRASTTDRLDVSSISSVPNGAPPSVSSQTSPPTTREQILASAAPCLSALDHSDAAISYLVGNIRDQRLSKSIQQYQADRRVCRERVG